MLAKGSSYPRTYQEIKADKQYFKHYGGTDGNIRECMESLIEIADDWKGAVSMGKKKSKRKVIPFKQDNRITYNTAKPNRQARRLGIVAVEPPKQEAPKRETKAAVLSRKVQQARQIQQKIVPPGMTYGEYMQYLKEKRQELEAKKIVAHNQD